MPNFTPDWIREVGAWVECLFEQHKLVRRSVMGVALVLLPIISYWTFRDPSQVTGGAATAYVGFTTMFGAMMKFYSDSRK